MSGYYSQLDAGQIPNGHHLPQRDHHSFERPHLVAQVVDALLQVGAVAELREFHG